MTAIRLDYISIHCRGRVSTYSSIRSDADRYGFLAWAPATRNVTTSGSDFDYECERIQNESLTSTG
jgi:hypothetical protein